MESAERLRQLREQHQLVARHLAWLESEIAAHSRPDEPSVPPPQPVNVVAPPQPQVETPDFEESLLIPSASSNQTRHQKLGCILFALATTAILLFLIWGLPLLVL